MCGAPWHGEAKLGYSTQTPLDEILYLGRGEDNEVGPVSTTEAVAPPDGLEFCAVLHRLCA